MSGRCHGCYRTTEADARKRQAKWAEGTRLRNLASAWDEGWTHYRENFSPSDPDFGVNPYLERLKDHEMSTK
ncbi:hypothetical protein AB4Z38_06875 [Arthrobacter sp. 2RAF6]|uniref:hypothetical protein n=1 Tax=Arthrobacter sp. 2RAF6 TaxID=3233002 RepID=UPI003F904F0C